MKKLINIPDEIVKDLKIMAVKNDKSLNKYIEYRLVVAVEDYRKAENKK